MKRALVILAIFASALPLACVSKPSLRQEIHRLQDKIMDQQKQIAVLQGQLEPTLAARQKVCAFNSGGAQCIAKNFELDQLQMQVKALRAEIEADAADLKVLVQNR